MGPGPSGPRPAGAPGRRSFLRGALAAALLPLLGRLARALRARAPEAVRPDGREARHWKRLG